MVKFVTKFNSESVAALNGRVLGKSKGLFRVLAVILVFLGAVILLAGLIDDPEAVEDDRVGDIIYGALLVLFGVFLFPLTKLLTKHMQKKVNSTMSIMGNDTTEIYVFDENGITIETEKPDLYSSRVKATYKYLFRVEEDVNCFYLYISKMQSHVIFKNCLEEGSLPEFYGYLADNFDSVKSSGGATVYYNKPVKNQ